MTHRLATNYAKKYCNRTRIVKVIVENVVTCFWGDTVYYLVGGQAIILPHPLVGWAGGDVKHCSINQSMDGL